MEILGSVLDPLCERVINAIVEEYQLVSNVGEEVKKLTFTVNFIKGLLRDAEKKRVKEEAVNIWLRSLKQILLDAEDVLEEHVINHAAFRTRLAIDRSAKVRNAICCFGSIDKLLKNRRTAHQIEDIRKKLDDKSKDIVSLGLQVLLGGNSWDENRRPRQPVTDSMLADESYIIGRGDKKERIIQLLLAPGAGAEQMSNVNKVHVLAIVGMGGVGKTTLAKLVFNDKTVEKHFQLMMWLCVSEDFDLKRITREIIDSAAGSNERKELSDITNWDLVKRRFKGVIAEKRFLLVLDDMWEEDPPKWESLYEFINCGGKGSKIIITTRSKKVSDVAKASYVPLESLSSEDLWPILQRYAFDGCDSNKQELLETVGKQIVENLKGSPLAAKTIGRLLNSNLDVKYWISIKESDIWTLPQHEDDILPILKLSYDHLPGHLKQVFAYCSLFPKDHIFNAGDLVQLWMAQNFIHTKRGLHAAESVGSEYLNDLLYQSFFEKGRDGKYLMHDLIHDLAESVSEDDCLRLVDDRSWEISETTRHVLIATNNFDAAKLKALCKQRNLRTLLLLHGCTFDLSPHLDEIFLKLKRLRVLGLSRCKIKELPASIGSLKHLRFLNLEWNPITELPGSLCYLHNLQVLKLKHCRWLGALPSNMNALINLRHLEADTKLVSNIQGLGRLTALQELSVSGTKVRELADMDMMRRLEISDLDQVQSKEEAQQARLCAKEDLDVLKLRWKGNRDDHSVNQTLEEGVLEVLQPVDSILTLHVVGYRGVKSPSWMEDQSWVSSSLERVKLKGCQNWEVLPPLGRLRCLKFLTIQGMRNVRQIGPQSFGYSPNGVGQGGGLKLQGFPSLEELKFFNMPVWEKWEVPIGDDVNFLPRLSILQVNSCPQLMELPPLPPSLTRLELVKVGLTRLPGWFRFRGEGNSDEAASSSCSYALSYLSVDYCQNLRSLNDGILAHSLQALKELQIERCHELESLPESGFSHLRSLESLTMKDCPKVSWPSSVTEDDVLPTSLQQVGISACGDNTMGVFLPMTMLQKLTSLGKLNISGDTLDLAMGFREFTSLTSLTILDGGQLNDTTLSTCLQGLTSLTSLSIVDCLLITTLSICLTSLTSLNIQGCPLITTLSICLTPLTSLSISCCPLITTLSICLTTLEQLYIDSCKELTSLGGLDALVCLKDLRILECPKLLPWVEAATSPSSSPPLLSPLLPPPTGTLLSLNLLKISGGDRRQVTLWLRQCVSLRILDIDRCTQLTCFDGEDSGDHVGRELEEALLNLAPSLYTLSFGSCENLRSLPSKLRCLSSLELLNIKKCPQIQRLPATGLPESLEYLYIYSCPALRQRCEEVGRPDWPLISHIPQVDFYINLLVA